NKKSREKKGQGRGKKFPERRQVRRAERDEGRRRGHYRHGKGQEGRRRRRLRGWALRCREGTTCRGGIRCRCQSRRLLQGDGPRHLPDDSSRRGLRKIGLRTVVTNRPQLTVSCVTRVRLPQMLTREEIYARVAATLVGALNVDEDE